MTEQHRIASKGGAEVHIVFVVVLYNTRVAESTTLRSLAACLRQIEGLRSDVLIFDNSKDPDFGGFVEGMRSLAVWCGENRGLAKSYNDALAFCAQHGASTLVTLDQDSLVPPDYVTYLVQEAAVMADPVVALCPRIVSMGRVISPYTIDLLGGRHYGGVGARTYAINAFSAYSVCFLQSIGGFEEFYWLDALDFSTFGRIARLRKQVHLLPVQVDHELSLLSANVSLARFLNITYFEACSLSQYDGLLKQCSGLVRIAVRAMKRAPGGSRLQFIFASLGAAFRGLVAGFGRRREASAAVAR